MDSMACSVYPRNDDGDGKIKDIQRISQQMTLKEAYKILGASKKDSDREIKSKYKKLLFLYHPDSDPGKEGNPEDDEKIRLIIEAYKKIRSSEGRPYYEDDALIFETYENRNAISERNVYIQLRIYDEDRDLPLTKLARGKYIWDPDMEEFTLFSKSVLEACKDLTAERSLELPTDKLKDLFHLMMQEYILPADAARKLGQKSFEDDEKTCYVFDGYIKRKAEGHSIEPGIPLSVFLRDNKAVAEEMITGKVLGQVSFDDDALYYVVLPLLEDPQIETVVTVKSSDKISRGEERIHLVIQLIIPKALKDEMVSNRYLIKNLIK